MKWLSRTTGIILLTLVIAAGIVGGLPMLAYGGAWVLMKADFSRASDPLPPGPAVAKWPLCNRCEYVRGGMTTINGKLSALVYTNRIKVGSSSPV